MARKKIDTNDPTAWIKAQLRPRSRRRKVLVKRPPVDYGRRVRNVQDEHGNTQVVVWPRPRA